MESILEALTILKEGTKEIRKTNISGRIDQLLKIKQKEVDSVLANYYELNTVFSDNKVSTTVNLFLKVYESGDANGFMQNATVAEVKHISFALVREDLNIEPLSLSSYLPFIIELLRIKWRNTYLSGLIISLLKFWQELRNEYATNGLLICKLLINKLETYDGKRKLYLFFKKNLDFFTQADGPIQLAADCKSSGLNPIKYFEEIGMPIEIQQYSYFNYFYYALINQADDVDEQLLNDISKYFKIESNQEIKRVLTSSLIIKCNETGLKNKEAVQMFALHHIADPQLASKWYIDSEKYKKYKDIVAKGREILNIWINSEVLRLFFEKLTMYPERKQFWQKYIAKVPDIKIGSTKEDYKKLSRDERLVPFLESRFITITSGSAVLLFRIKEYLLIEFAEQGNAFYAYHSSHKNYKKYNEKSISNSVKLKDTSLPLLGYNTRQGRFIHNSKNGLSWQRNMSLWLSKQIGI